MASAPILLEVDELADRHFKSAATKEQMSMAVTYKAKIKK